MKKSWYNLFKGEKGFTLIELIIVVIIVGVLAAIALPMYSNFVEGSRCAEAIAAIDAIKGVEETVRIETGAYVPAAWAVGAETAQGLTLNCTNWTYTFALGARSSIIITATRVGGTQNGKTIVFYNHWTTGAHGWETSTHPNHPKN